MSSTSFLARLVRGIPAGRWVAIRHNHPEVLGEADTPGEAERLALEKGDTDPLLMRIPRSPDSLFRPRARIVGGQPPYRLIARSITGGSVVPFLGAGASQIGRTADQDFDESRAAFYPSTAELTELIARECEFPPAELSDSDLARVSSYSVWKGGRGGLKGTLRRALGPIEGQARRCDPGALHHFIANERDISLIITTNYDTLIEDAFEQARRGYDLLVYPSGEPRHADSARLYRWDPDEHGAPAAQDSTPDFVSAQNLKLDFGRTIIFKMHGSLRTDSYVITEEDYLTFLNRMGSQGPIPQELLDHLQDKSLLFLGYSLTDWNLRLLLNSLEERDKAWAIKHNVAEAEYVLWQKRNVDIFDMMIEEFVQKLDGDLDLIRTSHR